MTGKMDKWEYLYVPFSGENKDNVAVTNLLNDYGKSGWEGFSQDDYGMWMKRRSK